MERWQSGKHAEPLTWARPGAELIVQAYGVCSKDSNAMKSGNPHSGFYEAQTSRTLDSGGGNPTCNQGGIAVVESYSIQGNMIGRKDENRAAGRRHQQGCFFHAECD